MKQALFALIQLLLTGALLSSGIAHAAYPNGLTVDETLPHDGQTRYFDVHVPAGYSGSEAVPLVIDLHGFTSNKTQQRGLSGFDSLSETENFIVVYPLGLHGDALDPEASSGVGPSWNGSPNSCCGAAVAQNTDDVGFIRTLIQHVSGELNIDSSRIYATGLSNGGAMSHALACHASDIIAAAVPVASTADYDPAIECPSLEPIAVLGIYSFTDQRVPYSTGTTAYPLWRASQNCIGALPDLTETIGGAGANCEQYTQCLDGVAVGICSVNGVGGIYLGHVPYMNTDGLDVAAKAWEFMQGHQLANAVNIPVLPWLFSSVLALLGVVIFHLSRRG